MLRRAENVDIHFRRGLLGLKGWVVVRVGGHTFWTAKISTAEYARRMELQNTRPWPLLTLNGRTYWLFQGRFHWENDGLYESDVYALLVAKQQRDRAKIERAQAVAVMGATPRRFKREVIPDEVKHHVWMRDSGRCRACGSQSELQFDHVIPLAMGGSSTVANLQVLCGPCNRRKGVGLTVG